jgi:hypothetical protein
LYRRREDPTIAHPQRPGSTTLIGLYSFEVEPFHATFVTNGWLAAKRASMVAGRDVLDEFNET